MLRLMRGVSFAARATAVALILCEPLGAIAQKSPKLGESSVYEIDDVSISSFVPAQIFPGQPFSISAQVHTRGDVSASALQRRLVTTINQAPVAASTTLAAQPGSLPASSVAFKQQVFLQAVAPTDLPAPPIQSTISIVDRADGRVFVTAVFPTLDKAPGPKTLQVLGQDVSWTVAAAAGAAIAALAALLFAMKNAVRARREAAQLQSELESARFEERAAAWQDSAASPVVDDDIVPELASEMRSGEMLLFVGAHLGEVVKEPALAEVLRRLIPSQKLSGPESRLASRALARGDLGRTADLIVKPGQEEQLALEVAQIFRGSAATSTESVKPPAPPLYRLLSSLPFTGVLTTTWSSRLEEAFSEQRPRVISPGSRNPTSALDADQFFVLHLRGQLDGDTPPLVSAAQVARYQRDGSFYARFLQSLVGGRSVLFIGATPDDIEEILSIGEDKSRPDCFAFMPEQMLAGQSGLVADLLRARYRVRISAYPSTLGDSDLLSSLAELRRQVGDQPQMPAVSSRRQFTALTLTNIGPFSSLQVELKAAWNVILGDNACGKSTILRAIALGLCGDAPQAVEPGSALLKSGASEGRVELQVGAETYVTSLYREDDGIRLICSGLTPVQRGGWVVLGFPPLRGVRLKHAERQPAFADPTQPQVGDVMPLLSGGVDVRVDDLCQWIASMSTSPRGMQLLNAFFGVLSDLAPTDHLALSRIDASGQVFVKTEDGEIPIEAVSQGMSSTIGWVGTLLQRMYEIYPDSKHPEAEPALILVDEIDAHLHPAWQRALIGLVQKHFKGLQVIATTHSPLVVASMSSEDVLIARRDPVERGQISVARGSDEVSLEGLRADQVLTSPLFGMRSTRSEKDSAKMDRYAQLLGLSEKTDAEERELTELRQMMERWMGEGPTNTVPARPAAVTGSGFRASITESDQRAASDRMSSFLTEDKP